MVSRLLLPSEEALFLNAFRSRLPVRGLHFWCAVCSHGGHHDCFRNYYLRRPMFPSSGRDGAADFASPGRLGWGLGAMIKRPDTERGPDSADSSRFSVRDSDAASTDSDAGTTRTREREGSIMSTGLPSVASIGAAIGITHPSKSGREKDTDTEKSRDQDSDRDRDRIRDRKASDKKRLMGHPCAAGCGHICWLTNEAIPGI